MNVLAVGGAGHVGSEVVKELLKRGASVRVLVRTQDTKLPDGAEAVVGELLDPVSIEGLTWDQQDVSVERRYAG